MLEAHRHNLRRGAGVAEQGCLLSSCTGKTGAGGSNPPLSAHRSLETICRRNRRRGGTNKDATIVITQINATTINQPASWTARAIDLALVISIRPCKCRYALAVSGDVDRVQAESARRNL